MTTPTGNSDKNKPQANPQAGKPAMGQKPQTGGCCGSTTAAKPTKPQGGCCN